jgi:hypothetical protein
MQMLTMMQLYFMSAINQTYSSINAASASCVRGPRSGERGDAMSEDNLSGSVCNTHGFPIMMHVHMYGFRHDSYESIHE